MTLQSKIIRQLLKTFVMPRYKDREKCVDVSKQFQEYKPPKILIRNFSVNEDKTFNYPIIEVKTKKEQVHKCIIFLHGGAYAAEISAVHWNFVLTLVKNTNMDVYIPIYPLSKPNYSPVDENLGLILNLYRKLLKTYKPEEIYIIGDSAGGGLGLAFCEYIKNFKLPQPNHLILICPWIDLTMSNQKMVNQSQDDWFIPYEGIQLTAHWYVQKNDPYNYKYSPLYGDLNDLAPITIFSATGDPLCHDIRRLHLKLQKLHINHDFYEFSELFHDFIVFYPLQDAKEPFEKIVQCLKG